VGHEIAREIVRVGYPLSGMQLIRTFGRFPFLFIPANLWDVGRGGLCDRPASDAAGDDAYMGLLDGLQHVGGSEH
jgi:hypothetical protein